MNSTGWKYPDVGRYPLTIGMALQIQRGHDPLSVKDIGYNSVSKGGATDGEGMQNANYKYKDQLHVTFGEESKSKPW